MSSAENPPPPVETAAARIRADIQAGRLDQAEEALRDAIVVSTGRPRAAFLLQLALILCRKAQDGRPECAPSAIHCLLATVEADPTWEEGYVRAVRYLQHLSDPRLCRALIRQGLEFHPNSTALRGLMQALP